MIPDSTSPAAALFTQTQLETVMDVKMDLVVRLGSCTLPMSAVMELDAGSVIQLDQNAKDPVGLFIRDKLIAYGEVVVVEDHFGIKIVKIVGQDVTSAAQTKSAES